MGDVQLDPTILIKASAALKSLIETIPSLPQELRTRALDDKVTVEDLKWIKENLPKEYKRDLYAAMEGSGVKLPAPIFPERSPELEKRCQKLRIEQDEREYKQMTRNIRESSAKEKPLSVQMKELNGILVTMVQLVVSVLTAFAFGYLAPYYLYGRSDPGPRIILGTLIAFFVGIADLYFIIRENLDEDGIKIAKKQ